MWSRTTNSKNTGASPEARSSRPEVPAQGPSAPGGEGGNEASLFQPEQPQRRLAELVISDSVRASLDTVLARIHHHETLYRDWGLAAVDPTGKRVVLNLYGPPGTGKSLCAEAIAHTLGRPFLRVDYAEIESKYVGETPKNIKAAFRRAAETGAVLFFDEADSILGKRLTNVTHSADQAVNSTRSTMLTQLDRCENVVIFATNFFSSYDPAFLRRIFAHVELPLPDEACRRELWRRLFPGRMPGIDALDLAELAARSEGLSGGDLLELVKRSASRAVQRSGGERRVTQADVLQEIEALRRTRRAHEGAPRWTPSDRDGPLAEVAARQQHVDADRTA